MPLLVEPVSELMLLRFEVDVRVRSRVAILAHQFHIKNSSRHVGAAMLLALDLLRESLVRGLVNHLPLRHFRLD